MYSLFIGPQNTECSESMKLKEKLDESRREWETLLSFSLSVTDRGSLNPSASVGEGKRDSRRKTALLAGTRSRGFS